VTLKAGRGQHRKYRPWAFTEHGAIMDAAILFTAREDADRSTANHSQILVVRADPEPSDALSASRSERAESITQPDGPVIAYFLEVQRWLPRIALP
jgi:hypothetical protein